MTWALYHTTTTEVQRSCFHSFWPQYSLALEEILQAQQTLLPLWPVGAGTVVQDLRHVLRLPQVMGDSSVPGAVWALRTGAGRVAVGVIVGVHPRGFVPPPQRLPLREEDEGDVRLTVWILNVYELNSAMTEESMTRAEGQLHQAAMQNISTNVYLISICDY